MQAFISQPQDFILLSFTYYNDLANELIVITCGNNDLILKITFFADI